MAVDEHMLNLNYAYSFLFFG
ncbi:uncharacterized protein G2W53_043110 [Senna tora]|uniref:Uncharacterized protein n=1 Tax=Senna tora TaxID=362788 RepID=A0A834SV18_9FABA|nr:uncharacterized protein G2W53_043110 [Senna tora]